jgi:molybdopterin converting factor small subunit
MFSFKDPRGLVQLRWSTDPIILATFKDLEGSEEADKAIMATPPNFVGNAREVLIEIKRIRQEIGMETRMWISTRLPDGTKVGLPEMRLVAALFCDPDNPMDWEFVDAQEMNRQHPDTFDVPTAEELKALRPGMYVKVCACNERFWVLVTGRDETGIVGIVNNDLVSTDHGLKDGDVVHFQERHIYSILE